jgi:hypothetical protein
MIPKKHVPDAIRDGDRFPACAKPSRRRCHLVDASAGEGRSDRIMRNKEITK